MTVLKPFVYWAQNENNLYIKVDLKDVKVPQIEVGKRKLHFQSQGCGAQGYKDYEFSIDFHSELDSSNKNNNIKITDHKVDLTLVKAQKGWWPRITSQPQKPIWLKVDFDRWQSEDDLLEEDVRDVREDFPDLYEKLQKEEMGYRKEQFKKVYLALYNLFMYVGFMYITLVICIRYIRDGSEFLPLTYQAVGPAMCSIQLLQFLEVLHPLFGYVKGGVLMPLLQVTGRSFVLLLMIAQEARLQTMPVVFYLFLTWSAIEIIRYPYYISQLYKKENSILTWLRYSAWIILYPIGFICEAVVVFRNLIFVEQSEKWSISLPNFLNVSFHFATFLRIYLLFVMIPGMYTLMSHMYKTRQLKLRKKNVIHKLKNS